MDAITAESDPVRQTRQQHTFTTSSTSTMQRRSKRHHHYHHHTQSLATSPSQDWEGWTKGDTSSTEWMSSLGLHQMRGYSELARTDTSTMQWADDDVPSRRNRGHAATTDTSTIAFPATRELPEDTRRSSSTISPTSYHDQGRTIGSRIESRRADGALQEGTKVSQWDHGSSSGSGSSTRHSSNCPSPESKVSNLDYLSLRQRSLKSLQGIATAWVPTSVRGREADQRAETVSKEGGSLTQRAPHQQPGEEDEGHSKKPIMLDVRRLEKAITTALEAGQVSKSNEKRWKDRKRRRAQRRSWQQREQVEKHRIEETSHRFASLPWKRGQARYDPPSTLLDGIGLREQERSSLVQYRRRGQFYEEGDSVSIEKQARQEFAGHAFYNDAGMLMKHGEADSDFSDEEEEEEEDRDDYAVDLYVSSLNYLLAALPARDVDNISERHREEMKRKLEQTIQHLDANALPAAASGLIDATDREEVIRLRVEREIACIERQREESAKRGVNRTQQAVHDSSQPQRSRKQSLATHFASTAFDLGLTVGAGLLAAASRGIGNLLPVVTSAMDQGDDRLTDGGGARLSEVGDDDGEKEVRNALGSTAAPVRRQVNEMESSPSILTRSQWDLTRTLALSVTSTMYSQLSTIAEQRRHNPTASDDALLAMQTSTSSSALTTTTIGPRSEQMDESDQLLLLAATLARNVKRSPLPSQLRALTSQVFSLAVALDQRYEISKRSTDVALRKTGQALYYVRKNDLHVKALRVVWAMVEASVAAVEAYRDEEGWKEGEGLVERRQLGSTKDVASRRP